MSGINASKMYTNKHPPNNKHGDAYLTRFEYKALTLGTHGNYNTTSSPRYVTGLSKVTVKKQLNEKIESYFVMPVCR